MLIFFLRRVVAMTIPLAVVVFICSSSAAHSSESAAVAMPDAYSAAAARSILEAGGNAVDASIAAAFVLAVTLPEAGNIGGGGFMTAYVAGKTSFLDFREVAPASATVDMFLDDNGKPIDMYKLLFGPIAIGVPGTVRGLEMAHKAYGTMSWSALLEPAITLAREGFVVHPNLAHNWDKWKEPVSTGTNFLEHFGNLKSDEVFKQPQLAATLVRLAEDPEDFYSGKTAEMLVASMEKFGGRITADDLKIYKAHWREPVVAGWRDYTIVTAPPPSSGGIALVQMLRLRDESARYFEGVGHNSSRYIHLLAEIEKLAFADRAEHLGDPDFVTVPTAQLLGEAYLEDRARQVDPDKISSGKSTAPGFERPDTTHFSIIDFDGNAVALTYTLHAVFGSGMVVEDAGFLLNNELADFSPKDDVPNAHGVPGKSSNSIEPNKRSLSSMTPTILLRQDKPVVVVGTPGGTTIFNSVFQVLLNLFDFQMSAQDAVSATRFHHQLPEANVIHYDENRVPSPELSEGLARFGYELVPNWWGDLGDVQLIFRESPKRLAAASDPRGRGVAEVIPFTETPEPSR